MLAKVRLNYDDAAGKGRMMRDPLSFCLSGSVWLCRRLGPLGFRSGL